MVLLHALHALGHQVTAAHVEHGLRGEESLADEDLVRSWCAAAGIPFMCTHVDPTTRSQGDGTSIQMAARELRYKALYRVADEQRIRTIAMAHHRDDALETLLIHLMRGSGPKGWASIPARSGRIVRPLLDIDRVAIEAYAREWDVPFREDASNTDPKYLRNRVRHELIPLMEDLVPGARSAMDRSLERLRELAIYWNSDAAVGVPDEVPFTHLDGSCGPPLLVLAKRLRVLGLHPHTLQQVLEAVRQRRTGARFVGKAHMIWVDREMLRIGPVQGGRSTVIQVDEDLSLPADAPITLEACQKDDGFGSVSGDPILDRDHLSFPLILRPWHPGDRMRPEGLRGSKLVSDILIDAKVPRDRKADTWVLVDGKGILWLVGHRVAEGVRATGASLRGIRCSVR